MASCKNADYSKYFVNTTTAMIAAAIYHSFSSTSFLAITFTLTSLLELTLLLHAHLTLIDDHINMDRPRHRTT